MQNSSDGVGWFLAGNIGLLVYLTIKFSLVVALGFYALLIVMGIVIWAIKKLYDHFS